MSVRFKLFFTCLGIGFLLAGCFQEQFGSVSGSTTPPETRTSVHGVESPDIDSSIANHVDRYILPRLHRLNIHPHLATSSELVRRMALDLAGRVPSFEEREMFENLTARQIADYYMDQPGFVEISKLLAADALQYSNDIMFSTIEQLEQLSEIVKDLYLGIIGYDEYVEHVIQSKAFLSRFTSSADRCTATFEKFVGFEPVTAYDFEFGNAFNGYVLSNRRAQNGDPDYHDYIWINECDRRNTSDVETCSFELWGASGHGPQDAARILSKMPMFAEHAVELTWMRFIGKPIERVAPELGVSLGSMFADSGFDMRRLIKEIVTSSAYTQSMTYRTSELVLE
jgi:hypothetical protein